MRIPIGFVARRVALTVPMLLAMSVIVFLIIRLIPGNPANVILGLRATPGLIREVDQNLHLNESLPQQYAHYLSGLAHGNLGNDFLAGQSVASLIGQAFPVTAELALLALLIGLVVGISAGLAAARGHGWARRATDAFVVFGTAVPDFWLAIMLVIVFAVTLAWLPPSGYVPLGQNLLENLRYFLLPSIALGVGQAAYLARTTRGAVEDVLRSPYVLFLRAKGLPERAIMRRHALRNAAGPIVTVVGIQFGILLGGAIIVETIFNLPGMGQLLINSIESRDYTVVQGDVLVVATLFICVNLLTDVLLAWIDPRVGDSRAA